MEILTIFSGWGPCGVLNGPGETEFYVVATALQLFALAVSAALLWIARSRFVKRFNTNKSPKPLYLVLNILAGLIEAAVAYTALMVMGDYIFGDANLGGYDRGVACDPIDGIMVAQAFIVLALTSILGYWHYSTYTNSKDSRQ